MLALRQVSTIKTFSSAREDVRILLLYFPCTTIYEITQNKHAR